MKKTNTFILGRFALLFFVFSFCCWGSLAGQCDRARDSMALVAFYEFTNGVGWDSTWILTNPMDTWYGVNLNGDGCLEGLVLIDNNLSGSFPDLDYLFLKEFDCSDNRLSGNIPTLDNVPFLETFNCSGNYYLRGSIPNLDNVPQLKKFDCSGIRNLTGIIPNLGNVSQLRSFLCHSNQLTGDIPIFDNVPFLETFNCSYNLLTGNIPNLGDVPQLRNFLCHSNELTGDVPIFDNVPFLETFNSSYNRLTGIVPNSIGILSNLKRFYANDNNLDTCFPSNLNNLCSIGFSADPDQDGYNFTKNPLLPWKGDFQNLCNGESQIGAYCYDSNSDTGHDEIQVDCTCRGTSISKRERDSLALVALYNSTNGANWDSVWVLTEPMDSWFGVTLNGDGRVNSLVLCTVCTGGTTNIYLYYDGNNLDGTLPYEIGDLSELTRLRINNNRQLKGTIPKSIGNLNKLQTFDFYVCKIEGGLPEEIGNLTSLRSIFGSGNRLTGSIPKSIKNLKELFYFRLDQNSIQGSIPEEIESLANLYYINLGSNNLSGTMPDGLGKLEQLLTLRLPGNEISGKIPKELGDLSNLQELYLNGNELTDSIPKELGKLDKLEEFYLGSNKLTGAIPKDFENLNSLLELDFSNNNLSGSIPKELGKLNSLLELDFSRNNLSGSIPKELGQLTNLKLIEFQSNELEGCFPSELIRFCNIDIARFYWNKGLSWEGDFDKFCDGEPQINVSCNDNNPNTTDDKIQPDCTCQGIITSCTVINTNDSGPGSLREAINCANDNPGADTIKFNIPGDPPFVIQSITSLETVRGDSTVIDGTTQPGWNMGDIEINGSLLPNNRGNGLTVSGNNIEVYGLYIHSFPEKGVSNGANRTKIGGIGKGNIISGNNSTGLSVSGSFFQIQGNYIGLRPDGSAFPNTNQGIWVLGNDGVIGGIENGEGNYVGGHITSGDYGIILNGVDNVDIVGNNIGNNQNNIASPNRTGIHVSGSHNIEINYNIIENNRIGIDIQGHTQHGVSDQVLISKNKISCNTYSGIEVRPGMNNDILPPVISFFTQKNIKGTSNSLDTIEIFISEEFICPSSPCQGKIYLGSTTSDISGNWQLEAPFQAPVVIGDMITATATDASNNTSEFSDCVAIQAPCRQSDSIALGTFFNAANGSAWLNKTNWFVPGQTVDTWQGVTIDSNGCVVGLDLSSNNLQNQLADLSGIDNLEFLILENNQLQGAIPDFSLTCPAIKTLKLSGNRFTFNDLVSTIDANKTHILSNSDPANPNETYSYAPQDSIFTPTVINLEESEDLFIDLDIDDGITNNVYSWYRGDTLFTTRNRGINTLSIPRIEQSEAGTYRVEITNSDAPDLTLYSYDIEVNVSPCSKTVSPDITLIDIDGNAHSVGPNAGICQTTVMQMFYYWCPLCWSLYQNGFLENIQNKFPRKVNTVMIDIDPGSNLDTIISGSRTQGDWITDNPHPIAIANEDNEFFFDTLSQYCYLGGAPYFIAICPSGEFRSFRYNSDTIALLAEINDFIENTCICEQTIAIDSTLCSGENLIVNGNIYDENQPSGADTLSLANCCDSIFNVNLNFNPTYNESITAEICSDTTYLLPDGTVVNTTNTYTSIFQSTSGCDSTITTNLNVLSPIMSPPVTAEICSGATYSLPDGMVVNIADTYTTVLQSVAGCDSTIITNLNVLPAIIGTIQMATICEGEIYDWNGQSYASSGNYSFALQTAIGCDSTARLQLTVEGITTLGAADAGSDQSTCDNSAELEGIERSGTTGNWQSLSGSNVQPTDQGAAIAENLGSGANEFVWSLSSTSCADYDQDTVSVFYQNQPPVLQSDIVKMGRDSIASIDILQNDNLFDLSFNVNCFNWQEVLTSWRFDTVSGLLNIELRENITGETIFGYSVCSIECPNLCDSTTVFLQTDRVLPDKGEVNIIINPNGDGLNDVLKFDLDPADPNELTIFNRWGNAVFQAQPYQNDWDGTRNGKRLPEATYYYVLSARLPDKILFGSVTLNY